MNDQTANLMRQELMKLTQEAVAIREAMETQAAALKELTETGAAIVNELRNITQAIDRLPV